MIPHILQRHACSGNSEPINCSPSSCEVSIKWACQGRFSTPVPISKFGTNPFKSCTRVAMTSCRLSSRRSWASLCSKCSGHRPLNLTTTYLHIDPVAVMMIIFVDNNHHHRATRQPRHPDTVKVHNKVNQLALRSSTTSTSRSP